MTEQPVYEINADHRTTFIDGLRAVRDGFLDYPLWIRVAWLEIKQSYFGSVLGPFWVTLTTGLMSAGLGLAYAKIFGAPVSDFLPYVAAGLVVWGSLSSMINEGTQVFVRAAFIMKQVNVPLLGFVFKTVLKSIILFFFRFAVLIVIAIIFSIKPTWIMLYAIPGMLLIFFTAIWVMLFLGTISARFRDFGQLAGAMLTFIFFMTPIFWKVERLGEYAVWMNFNPFYHFIAIVREPLLGNVPSLINYQVCGGIAVVMLVLSIVVFSRAQRRIPYWC
jgi:ABC-2 type transport system permease protein/lipopolysaccharide transport system permease protein